MEKLGSKSKSRSFSRLLVFFLILNLSFSVAAQTEKNGQNFSEKNSHLQFVPEENQNFFVNEELDFVLHIPEFSPNQIEIDIPPFPSDVQFKMLRKTEDYKTKGTRIDLWFSFTQEGYYNFDDISVFVKTDGKTEKKSVDFPAVTIKKDISKERPQIVLVFEDGTIISNTSEANTSIKQKGKAADFSVNVQFARKIFSFDYEIPKNSILKLTNEYDYKKQNFQDKSEYDYPVSEDLIPLAEFSLFGGQISLQQLPDFSVQVENYNGEKEEIKFANHFIEYLKAEKNENSDDIKQKNAKKSDENIFGDAFSVDEEKFDTEKEGEPHSEKLTYEECKKKAQKIGLKRVLQLIVIFICVGIFAVIVIFVILGKMQKMKWKITECAFVLVAAFFVLLVVFTKNKIGVFTGGKLYAIPDKNTVNQTECDAGSTVKILEQTEKWFYVQSPDNTGWCEKEKVICSGK